MKSRISPDEPFPEDLGRLQDEDVEVLNSKVHRENDHEVATEGEVDPETAARVESLKKELLEHAAVRAWSGSLWSNAKTVVLDAAADPDSELRARVTGLILEGARLLESDPTVRELVQRHAHGTVGYLAERFSRDIAELVSGTVARWDTYETSQRIELQVGRDLQWIRVNGTVVGGLAGLVIYSVAQLIG